MRRKIIVAHTPPDKDNVNRLRIPEFGVLKLCLAVNGKLSSKSYLPHGVTVPTGVTIPKQDDAATDDFHFAPEKEKVKIAYRIDDPFGSITKAKLELFRRNVEAPVWKEELEQAEYAHSGDKDLEFRWDGKIGKSNQFPLEYITVEHSPYKLKMTLEGNGYGYCKTAWTFFHVLIAKLHLELGLKEAVANPRDKDLWDALKDKPDLKDCIPANGQKKEVRLVSNLFSTGQDKTDNSLYTTYETKWGDGPNIPIFVKASIKTSDDKEVVVPKAVGKVRLLWDWEDVPEVLSMHFPQAEEFLKDALDRYKNKTRPQGDNCHMNHGGKRGGNKPVFPSQAGYPPNDVLTPDTFPFQVEAGAARVWSSYSYTWASGQLAGQSGVMFQPSRMAGDAYRVHVYFPHHRTWDGQDELDNTNNQILKHAVTECTGTFQIWREIHLVRYLKKNLNLKSIKLANVQAYFEKAYIRLVDKTGGPSGPMIDYNAKLIAALNQEPPYRQVAVMVGDQGALTNAGIKFVSYDDWKQKVEVLFKAKDQQFDLVLWLQTNQFHLQEHYKELLEHITDAVLPKALGSYLSLYEGITILQFHPYWEADGGLKSSTSGYAATTFPSGDRTKAAFIMSWEIYSGVDTMEQTAAHEIGHTLFLPHASNAAIDDAERRLHDQACDCCLMSYNFSQERRFCGLCLLRMRGWDQRFLSPNGQLNKKL